MSELVVLKNERETIKVNLVSNPNLQIEFYKEATVADQRKMADSLAKHSDQVSQMLALVISRVKDWNLAFQNEDWEVKKMAFEIESLDALTEKDLTLCIEKITWYTLEQLNEMGAKSKK